MSRFPNATTAVDLSVPRYGPGGGLRDKVSKGLNHSFPVLRPKLFSSAYFFVRDLWTFFFADQPSFQSTGSQNLLSFSHCLGVRVFAQPTCCWIDHYCVARPSILLSFVPFFSQTRSRVQCPTQGCPVATPMRVSRRYCFPLFHRVAVLIRFFLTPSQKSCHSYFYPYYYVLRIIIAVFKNFPTLQFAQWASVLTTEDCYSRASKSPGLALVCDQIFHHFFPGGKGRKSLQSKKSE